MGPRTLRFAQAALCCLLFISCASALADELIDRARRLMAQQRPQEAFRLLENQESSRAGDPEFDYLLGIAANDAGQHERAIFALERVLAVQPNNALARAEIARAYFAVGEKQEARREFEIVRNQQVPTEARATIERYLAAIAATDVTRISGFFELGAGYDTNVNAATGASQVALPALGGIIATLNPAATRQSDGFGSLAGGLNITRKLSETWSVIGSAAGSTRLHHDQTSFDEGVIDASLGARWARDANSVTLGAQIENFDLDWARYRETRGLVAQWQHNLDERRQLSLFGQHTRIRYPTQTFRDVDRDVAGVAFGEIFTTKYSPVVYASAYVGHEQPLTEGFDNVGDDLWGVRFGGQLRLGNGWSALGSAAYERRYYGGPEPIFLLTRQDKQIDVSAGVSYLLRANTIILAQIQHTDNRSNVPIDEFDRTVTSLTVRWNF